MEVVDNTANRTIITFLPEMQFRWCLLIKFEPPLNIGHNALKTHIIPHLSSSIWADRSEQTRKTQIRQYTVYYLIYTFPYIR